jgi:Terminase large subunit, T4likevirus-type, N-terminal
MIMGSIIACCSYEKITVGFFRRKFTQLQGPGGAIMRSHSLLAEMANKGLAKYNEQKNRWTFFNGSVFQFCHLQHEGDVHNYQSQQFDIICFDEATHFTRGMYRYMLTRNRRSNVENTIPRPFVMMGTNPGGVGHVWFKDDFIYAGEPERVQKVEVEPGKFEEHIFIPAKLSDNMALEDSDPEYRQNLENQPEHIRRQLLDGDWDAIEGVAFPEFRREVHVIEPFEIDPEWIRFRSLDWGHAKPYSVGWYAVDYDGRLYKYRELYGAGGEADKGSREDPADVAFKIWQAEHWQDEQGRWQSENIRDAVADDAIFGGRQDNSKDIAEQFHDQFRELDKKHGTHTLFWRKVGKGGKSRISGKLEVHQRLKIPKEDGKPSGEKPMLLFFNVCFHTLRTLPELLLDEKNPEDVDTTMEDHAYDETRYACMSRPMVTKPPKEDKTAIQKHKQHLISKRKINRQRIL